MSKLTTIAIAGTTFSTALAGPPRYTVRDLGVTQGSSVCICFFGEDLNESGQAAVRFFSAAGNYATMFHDGSANVSIGTLGGPGALPRAINDHGAIAGFSDTAAEQHAFLWQAGEFTDLGSLAAPSRPGHSDAEDLNNAMQVVGSSQDRNGHTRPFLWSPSNGMLDLGTFGGEFGDALGVNENGDVVGWAWNTARDRRPFLWTTAAGLIDLGDLGAGSATATDINDAGLVVGVAPTGASPSGVPEQRAVLWTAQGRIANLGTLPNGGVSGLYGPELVNSAAVAINNHAQIVGNATPATVLDGAFLYENGQMLALTDLVRQRDWRIIEVRDINDKGQIIATGRLAGGDPRAVILSPIDCIADLTGNGTLDIFDFLEFQNLFIARDPWADCDQSTGQGVFDVFDFLCFQDLFVAGCD